jgi:enoyl-CoA hydratase/carnithine racemase
MEVGPVGVTYESREGIGFIMLDRPEKLNALNDEMARAVQDAVYQFDDDDDANVAVLYGAGRAFCAGADVIEKQLRPREELVRFGGPTARGAHIQTALLNVTNWKPIIAAVHGYVLGSGLRLAMHCDLIVAAESTRFQITETKRGLDGGGYWMLLAQRCPWSFASDVTLTSRFWTAAESLQAQLINEVVPDTDYLSWATEMAAEIAKLPPRSVRGIVRNRRAELAVREQQVKWARDPSIHLTPEFHASARQFADSRTSASRDNDGIKSQRR